MKGNKSSNRSGNNTRSGLPLIWLLVILLSVAGCSLLTPPTGSGTSSGTATGTGQSIPTGTGSVPSTAPPTPSGTPTSQPTASTGTTAAPTTATPTPRPTAAPTTATPTPKPTTTKAPVNLSSLSATARSWYYTPAKERFKDVRATIPSDISKLIAPWQVIWQAKPTGQKTVYLTMDEGYEFENNTREILDVAASKNVRIAFFITGSYLRNQPALVKRMLAEGHLVVNHTDTHPNLATLYSEKGAQAVLADIQKLETDFHTLTGQTMRRLMRPSEGAYSERLLGLLTQNGYRTVFWSFAYRDWLTAEQPDPAAARDIILGQLHDGSIILLHAVSDTNVALLPQLIDAIRERGYRFGQLTDIP